MTTLDFYDQNAAKFTQDTISVPIHDIQEVFLSYLDAGARILDLGCGSGRDTKYFLERGFRADAMDGSEELCRAAAAFTGIPVRHMLFQELEAEEQYDGIWACASLLHVPGKELSDVFDRIRRALNAGGILYASFKYGTFEGLRGERYYTDFTEETFAGFLASVRGFEMERIWRSADARPERRDETWLNMILRKQNIR